MPLEPPFYLPPGVEFSQGDIFVNVPSMHIESRPAGVARPHQQQDDRHPQATFRLFPENAAEELQPDGGFKWRIDQGGEVIHARAYMGMAVVLTHDCEIDKDTRHRVVAMVRPITDVHEAAWPPILRLQKYASFPFPAQEAGPSMALSFVDFRRLTTVRPGVLEVSSRYATLSADMRGALAEHFWNYLFRRQEAHE